MACINPNTPEFKKALQEAGGNPLLAEIDLSQQQTASVKIENEMGESYWRNQIGRAHV